MKRLAGWALVALVVFLVFPARVTVDGVGVLQPPFEQLVPVAAGQAGMVSRLDVARGVRVEAGAPLLAFVPAGEWAVLAYGRMAPPRGAASPPEPVPPGIEATDRLRRERMAAADRWRERVRAVLRDGSPRWELQLAQRLAQVTRLESELALRAAQADENIRRGRSDANSVQIFDGDLGRYRATADGLSVTSPAAGIVYSLWTAPRVQIWESEPVAEIMRDATPIEVLALVSNEDGVGQGALDRVAAIEGLAAPLASPGPLRARVTGSGRAPLVPADARLLFPALPVERTAVFVRIEVASPVRAEDLGRAVRVRLTSGYRPRIWTWIPRMGLTGAR